VDSESFEIVSSSEVILHTPGAVGPPGQPALLANPSIQAGLRISTALVLSYAIPSQHAITSPTAGVSAATVSDATDAGEKLSVLGEDGVVDREPRAREEGSSIARNYSLKVEDDAEQECAMGEDRAEGRPADNTVENSRRASTPRMAEEGLLEH
jgi:hypothetical protein